MITDPVLVDDWHPVVSCDELAARPVVGARLLGEDIVVWQADGRARSPGRICACTAARGCRSAGLMAARCNARITAGSTAPSTGYVRIPALPDAPHRARRASRLTAQSSATAWSGSPWANRRRTCRPLPNGRMAASASCCAALCESPQRPGSWRTSSTSPFPFVHENVLGTPERPEISDYQAVITDQGVEATGVRVYQPDPYGTGQGDWVSYTYRGLRPFTAYLLKESSGPRFSILLTITPHEPARSAAWMWMAMNYGHDVPRPI